MNESTGTTKSQLEKFREAAREHETDDSEDAFDARLKLVASASKAPKNETRAEAHASDCAVHNMPAYSAGECTCGATTARR